MARRTARFSGGRPVSCDRNHFDLRRISEVRFDSCSGEPCRSGAAAEGALRRATSGRRGIWRSPELEEHPRPQDDDGTTSEDPLQELIKRFEVASKVILNGVHTAPTRLRWLHPGDFARDSLTRPWLSRLRTVGSL
jgi:hypothetical protein